ncbi:MAG: hypothetical protein ACRDUX_17710, partial [Mycobacterium sp.]
DRTMLTMSRRTRHRSLIWVGLGCLLLVPPTAVRADAAAAAAAPCAAHLQRLSTRSLERTLRCLAREKRRGSVDPACLSRAASIRARMMRGPAECVDDALVALDTINRCTAAVLAHVSDDGGCAARKLRAVAASVRHHAPGGHSTGQRAALCQAFERGGTCAGDCLAVDAALARCWTAIAPQRTLPAVAPDDQVILFGVYEGDAISSSTIAGQDEDTETARVVIEPGATPLYALLTSYAEVIWRFEGDVSRVRRVVLLGAGPRGVTGIAAERVADLTGTNSDLSEYFYSNDSPEGRRVRNAVEDALGRPVDIVAGSYSVGTLSLPAGIVEGSSPPAVVPPGFDPAVYQLGLWFNPGGVVDIDPSLVVSTARAEPYEVLPQGFGLAQLVAVGALEPRDGYFYIARAIPRFPAGLYGAHSVTFMLGRGVPLPAGSPGHSCVIAEETGRPVINEFSCVHLSRVVGGD